MSDTKLPTLDPRIFDQLTGEQVVEVLFAVGDAFSDAGDYDTGLRVVELGDRLYGPREADGMSDDLTLEERMTRAEAEAAELRAMAERIVLLLRGTAGAALEVFSPRDDED